MKNNFIKKAGIILLAVAMLPASLFAHSGRTDSRGGHKDNKNKSGLGSYHYHCNGNPPHLHRNGCPYSGVGSSSSSSSSSKSSSSSSSLSSSSSTPKPAKPTYKATTAKFNIGGTSTEIDGIIDNEMTLVEMRPLCDALGITINWDSSTSTASCSNGNVNFSLTVGTKSAKLNGQPYALERSPKVVNGKTMIPTRFVAEAIGKSVMYNSNTGVIEIADKFTKGVTTNSISAKEMKEVGVKFVTINNQHVASLWNSAIYYNVGSNIVETKYMLGDKTSIKLSDKIKVVDGVTIFPLDVMDYLYIESKNVEIAIEAIGISDYEIVKKYWTKK